MTERLKMISLPKHLEHFPAELQIRGKYWTRHLISGVYHQIQEEETKVLGYGLYKAIIVKKEYKKRPGYSDSPVYGLYVYPIKYKRGK